MFYCVTIIVAKKWTICCSFLSNIKNFTLNHIFDGFFWDAISHLVITCCVCPCALFAFLSAPVKGLPLLYNLFALIKSTAKILYFERHIAHYINHVQVV